MCLAQDEVAAVFLRMGDLCECSELMTSPGRGLGEGEGPQSQTKPGASGTGWQIELACVAWHHRILGWGNLRDHMVCC